MTAVERQETIRWFCLCWLYTAAIAHSVVGLLLTWVPDLLLPKHYLQHIDAAFLQGAAPALAHAQQQWWIRLFGATIQSLGLWMLALVYFGHRYRAVSAWKFLLLGLVLWAPQDIALSLQRSVWLHVWNDLAAVTGMAPPLIWLWRYDRKTLNSHR